MNFFDAAVNDSTVYGVIAAAPDDKRLARALLAPHEVDALAGPARSGRFSRPAPQGVLVLDASARAPEDVARFAEALIEGAKAAKRWAGSRREIG